MSDTTQKKDDKSSEPSIRSRVETLEQKISSHDDELHDVVKWITKMEKYLKEAEAEQSDDEEECEIVARTLSLIPQPKKKRRRIVSPPEPKTRNTRSKK